MKPAGVVFLSVNTENLERLKELPYEGYIISEADYLTNNMLMKLDKYDVFR
jgi:hypothetical protein